MRIVPEPNRFSLLLFLASNKEVVRKTKLIGQYLEPKVHMTRKAQTQHNFVVLKLFDFPP